MVVIVQGRISVLRDTASGKRMILRSLGPGASVGFSALGGAAHTADLIAAENSTVLVIPGRVLRDAIRRDPALALRALAELGETIGAAESGRSRVRKCTLKICARRCRSLPARWSVCAASPGSANAFSGTGRMQRLV